MDARTLALPIAVGRVAIGAALMAAPGRAAAAWIGPRQGRRPETRLLATAVGARDLAVGLGGVAALRAGTGARAWMLAGALADATDLAATLRHRDAISRSTLLGVAALAGSAAAAGAAVATRL